MNTTTETSSAYISKIPCGSRMGFRKDKGGEKLAESEEDLLEHRTDGTDAFDTLYIGCEKFPQMEITPNTYSVSGVI